MHDRTRFRRKVSTLAIITLYVGEHVDPAQGSSYMMAKEMRWAPW